MYIRRPCGCRCVQYSILGGKAQGVRAIFLRQWIFSFLVGQGRGGSTHPAGGLPSLPPATSAFSLLCCPHPPDPRSQSALPGGKGETKVFLCKGLRPLHPRGLNPGGTGEGRRLTRRRGAEAGCYNKFEESSGGLGDSFKSPPALLCPLHPRGLKPGVITNSRKVLGGSGDSFKSPPALLRPLHPRGLKPDVITNSRKVLGGSGDSFKSPPAFLPP